MTRRQMLAGAAAFAFRPDTLGLLEPLLVGSGEADDEDFWRQIRSRFDIDPEITVFNNAGLSPSPIVVREAIEAQAKRANTDPSFHIWRRQENELGPIVKRLATLIGCKEDELALTLNCTYGLQTGVLGAPMAKGDQILTTSHDYPRAHTAMHQRERREGIKVVKVPITSPPELREKVAQSILDQVTPDTKLVLMSQMTFVNGQLMPVKEVAEGLKGKSVPLFVDAAHGIGLLPDKLDELGADIYAACLHKWLMGPVGTGVFVVRKPWISKIWPMHPADPELDYSIHRFEQIGSHPVAPFLALKESLDFHDMLGRERKAARLEYLRKRLADVILETPKAIHFGSLDPDVCRAVFAVGFKNVSTGPLSDWLYTRHRIHVTTMTRVGVDCLRISPNVFTTIEEIDRLGAILAEVGRKGFD